MSDSSAGAGPDLTAADGTALARYAASVIRHRLGGGPAVPRLGDSDALRRRGASFVTLERSGSLRGCIGTLDARLPLYRDVARNAVRAMTDPRLSPVRPAEWPGLDVSVSVLGPLEPLPVTDWVGLCAALRPGVDGVVICADGRRATFLPVVWARLAEPEAFLTALLAKGGWPGGQLPEHAVVRRYTTTSFRDQADGREG
jgi:AmmeMemoRadiSam system protein A